MKLTRSKLQTDLVPSPVEFSVLTPEAHEGGETPLPLMLALHGGNGDNGFLGQIQPVIERAWKDRTLPPLIAVTPDADRSFYMDFRDGSQKWESFILGPLLDHLGHAHRLVPGREGTVILGISMGGLGALRLGFKHSDRFAGVAALEPGIEPALAFRDIEPRDRFYRPHDLYERIYGDPVDEAYWQDNNPANITKANAAAIGESHLAIYVECGDEDSFGLHRGAEFLHRILFDDGIPHQYRLV